jgi:hypothetical protein
MISFLDDLLVEMRTATDMLKSTEQRMEEETPRAYSIYLYSNVIVFGVGWGALLTALILAFL